MADEQTGNELRQFFVELLADGNLQEYYSERAGYIDFRVRRVVGQEETGFLGEEALRVLQEGTLAEIEENIKLVTGSSSAVPLIVVAPPGF